MHGLKQLATVKFGLAHEDTLEKTGNRVVAGLRSAGDSDLGHIGQKIVGHIRLRL